MMSSTVTGCVMCGTKPNLPRKSRQRALAAFVSSGPFHAARPLTTVPCSTFQPGGTSPRTRTNLAGHSLV